MLWKPGQGIDINQLAKGDVSEYVKSTTEQGLGSLLLHLVHSSFIKAFAEGDMLQVLFFSVLFGVALTKMERIRESMLPIFEQIYKCFLRCFRWSWCSLLWQPLEAWLSPFGKFGIAALLPSC
jgi:aerobic C4-dicarboxylate transport protein